MRHEKPIREAKDRLELAVPRLKETVSHREMMPFFGALDALKWVLMEPSNFEALLRETKETNTDKTYHK